MYARFAGVVFVFVLCLALTCADAAIEHTITPFTGSVREWNPGIPTIDLESVRAHAGIAPHHGLASETIARFYDNMPRDVERVILLGPDHFKAGRNNVTICPLAWRVGNNVLEVDDAATSALISKGGAAAESIPFRLEHSIGLHIVFINRYFPNSKVTALMVKNTALFRELSKLVPVVSELLMQKGTIIILSMDFSHDKMPEEAGHEDDKSVNSLLSFDSDNLEALDIDAPRAAWLFLEALKRRGTISGTLLERTNSSEITNRLDLLCTSYATMIFR